MGDLQSWEMKACDAPEDLWSDDIKKHLKKLTSKNASFVVDLKPYTDCSTFTVQETFSLDVTYNLFRSMGLRHLVVVDAMNSVVGIITRHNLVESNLKRVLQLDNLQHPDEVFNFLNDSVLSSV